jgi:predicted transcriptional regulator of viral defense system
MYILGGWDFLQPMRTLNKVKVTITAQKGECNTVGLTQKRQDLIEQVKMIKTWGRGIIAKIAANLERTIGAVRQMLSVLTKQGILVRIQRGQYTVS